MMDYMYELTVKIHICYNFYAREKVKDSKLLSSYTDLVISNRRSHKGQESEKLFNFRA